MQEKLDSHKKRQGQQVLPTRKVTLQPKIFKMFRNTSDWRSADVAAAVTYQFQRFGNFAKTFFEKEFGNSLFVRLSVNLDFGLVFIKKVRTFRLAPP